MSLSKDQILEVESDVTVVEVQTPEWNGSVFVRSLSGNERDQYEQAVFNNKESFRGLRAKLVAIGLCDKNGVAMGFSDAEIEQLGNKNGAVIDRLFERIKQLSGMADDAIKEAEKN